MMQTSRFKRVSDEPGHTRWELDGAVACQISSPRPGGQIWQWSAWLGEMDGDYELGMARSKVEAEKLAKQAAVLLLAGSLGHGATGASEMDWDQGLLVDLGGRQARSPRRS